MHYEVSRAEWTIQYRQTCVAFDTSVSEYKLLYRPTGAIVKQTNCKLTRLTTQMEGEMLDFCEGSLLPFYLPVLKIHTYSDLTNAAISGSCKYQDLLRNGSERHQQIINQISFLSSLPNVLSEIVLSYLFSTI